MSDVVISYKSEERAKAKALAELLTSRNLSVWWDPEIEAGERFDDRIELAIREASCVVVLWSMLSVKSTYVRDEAALASSLGKLVPVRIDSTELPFRFSGFHTLTLTDWSGATPAPDFDRLLRDIRRMVDLGRGTPSAPKTQVSSDIAERSESLDEAVVPSTGFVRSNRRAIVSVAVVGIIGALLYLSAVGTDRTTADPAAASTGSTTSPQPATTRTSPPASGTRSSSPNSQDPPPQVGGSASTPSGGPEKFTIRIPSEEANERTRHYEAMGYTVLNVKAEANGFATITIAPPGARSTK